MCARLHPVSAVIISQDGRGLHIGGLVVVFISISFDIADNHHRSLNNSKTVDPVLPYFCFYLSSEFTLL